jgi:hypothetical protein
MGNNTKGKICCLNCQFLFIETSAAEPDLGQRAARTRLIFSGAGDVTRSGSGSNLNAGKYFLKNPDS